jgi:hypothetical protein
VRATSHYDAPVDFRRDLRADHVKRNRKLRSINSLELTDDARNENQATPCKHGALEHEVARYSALRKRREGDCGGVGRLDLYDFEAAPARLGPDLGDGAAVQRVWG